MGGASRGDCPTACPAGSFSNEPESASSRGAICLSAQQAVRTPGGAGVGGQGAGSVGAATLRGRLRGVATARVPVTVPSLPPQRACQRWCRGSVGAGCDTANTFPAGLLAALTLNPLPQFPHPCDSAACTKSPSWYRECKDDERCERGLTATCLTNTDRSYQ